MSKRVTQLYSGSSQPSRPKRAPSGDHDTAVKKLTKNPPKLTEAPLTANPALGTKPGEPWADYEPVYEACDLKNPNRPNARIIVAIRKNTQEMVHVNEMSSKEGESAFLLYSRYKHRNIRAVIQAFSTEDRLYLVCEESRIQLYHLAASPKYLNETQFGAILGQILDALIYLGEKDIYPKGLSCYTVFMDSGGTIKLDLTMFEHLHTDANECLESLHTMSLLLMQKDSGPGITGKHWEESPVAVDFVASVTSKQPLSILRRHELFSRSKNGYDYRRELLALIMVVDVAMQREYRIM